jgi:peptidyl-prolyl cis-trans isomerase SurA
MKKNITQYVLSLLLVITVSYVGVAKASSNLDRIVAVVGEDIITFSELEEKTKLVSQSLTRQNIDLPAAKVLQRQVLNKIVLDQIQLQLAQQAAIEVDSSDLNRAIADLAKGDNLTVAEYKQQLQKQGMSFNDFREQVRNELILARLQQREVGSQVRVSLADVEGYLNSPIGQDNTGTEYRLAHILIVPNESINNQNQQDLEAKVAEIINEARKGKDFKSLAAAHSSGAQALEGGDLGWRKISEVPTLFVNHVAGMKVHEVIGPIQSPSGLHIIKLQDKRTGNKKNYQEVKVRQILIKPSVNISDKEAAANLLVLKKKILKGQDFAKLAEKHSEELTTAANGGNLGWVNKNSVVPTFWDKISKLPAGEVSDPFRTELGWHLVQVMGNREASDSRDAMRNRISNILREQKFNEILEVWLKKIRDQAKVEILL